MKTKIFLLAAAFLLAVQGAGAQQEAAEVDSVMLAGKVVNHHSHRIYRNCYMRFVQEGRTVAETVTDTVGEFVVAALPVGRVELHECKDCVIHAEGLKRVVLQGLEGFIVSEKNGQLLVCKRSEEQRIKEFSSAQ